MLVCDLHIHSNVSKDGESSLEEIISRAEAIGLDAIAITDHDAIEGALRALEYETSVLIIPGIEISTSDGHLIALGVTQQIPSGLDLQTTIEIAREMDAVLVLPHPYHFLRHGVGQKKKIDFTSVDAIETFNSRYLVGSANRKAATVAQNLGKAAVGGSDAHNAKFVGFGKTYVNTEERDISEILSAIKNGKTRSEGIKTPLRTYTQQSLRSTWKKIRRLTRSTKTQ